MPMPRPACPPAAASSRPPPPTGANKRSTAPLSAPGEWTTLIEGSDAFYLTGFELYRDFYVTEGRVRAIRTDATAVLILPADLPAVSSEELAHLIGEARGVSMPVAAS